jgi:hypothetical protein
MNSTSASIQSAGRLLSREELTSVKNLFLLNLANKDFLLGTKKRRPNVPTLIVPILIVLLVVFLVVITTAGTSDTGNSGNVLIGSIVLFVIPGLIGIGLTFRAYRRALLLDTEGKLLQGTISSISVYEHSKFVTVLLWALAIVVIILAIIDTFSGNGSGSSWGGPSGDSYVVTIEYTVTTPTGRQISGKAKHNRPDLRANGLPQEGDPIVILYRDDSLFKPM